MPKTGQKGPSLWMVSPSQPAYMRSHLVVMPTLLSLLSCAFGSYDLTVNSKVYCHYNPNTVIEIALSAAGTTATRI